MRAALEGAQSSARAAAAQLIPLWTLSNALQRTRTPASRVLRPRRRSHRRAERAKRKPRHIVRPPCLLVVYPPSNPRDTRQVSRFSTRPIGAWPIQAKSSRGSAHYPARRTRDEDGAKEGPRVEG